MLISKMVFNEAVVFKNIFFSPYSLHQAIWSLFADSPDRERDFLYRLDVAGKMPMVYAISKREPQDTKGFWNIRSKQYRPKIESGIHLGFTVRVNPVRKIAAKRHDVVMDAKFKARKEEQKRITTLSTQEIISQACGKWIEQRSDKNGFKLLQFRIDGYQQVKFVKPKGGGLIQYSTVDITGILKVINSQLFTRMLFSGLGPSKGFGCGLMLVRRVAVEKNEHWN